MPQLFLLFSHELTPEQQDDAEQSLGVTTVRFLPSELQDLWSQVPPGPDSIIPHAQPIWAWLSGEARPGDYVLVQGEFGMTYATVQKVMAMDLVPVYATSRRQSKEIRLADGRIRKIQTFNHVRFRQYEL